MACHVLKPGGHHSTIAQSALGDMAWLGSTALAACCLCLMVG